jgi:uncharacterized protein (DUF2062 family)
MNRWIETRKLQAAGWLRTGMSPRRLALTLALGFAIGCLPIVGIPTALCLMLAMTLRLNVPAIQAANYVAMPVQLALMVPFVRLGRWMFTSGPQLSLGNSFLHGFSLQTLWASGSVAGQALGAWLVFAGPAVLLMTFALTPVLQRVPAVATDRRS